MLSRRQFIRAGLLGAALLTTVAVLRRPGLRRPATPVIDAAAEAVIAAIAAVVLKGALTGDGAVRKSVDAVKVAVANLSAPAQAEIGELFGLLAFAPTRIAVAKVSAPWPQATEAEIAAFLQSWRDSRLPLLQSGYQALHDLVTGSWYADPATWPAIGYSGPPNLMAKPA